MDLSPTKLDYYHDMWKLQSKATLLSFFKGEDGRNALILDSTIFHPQGGGQPADTGVITSAADSSFKFIVQDVRSKDGIVYHYGVIEGGSGKDFEMEVVKGREVLLFVDEVRRKLNSRLHSAGHLLDACMQDVGLGQLEPGKGYHFPDGPFARFLLLYCHMKKLQNLCGGFLPDYISKDSTPRVVKLGNSAVCCGGTHVSDISEIISLQVSQIRKRKGVTKLMIDNFDCCFGLVPLFTLNSKLKSVDLGVYFSQSGNQHTHFWNALPGPNEFENHPGKFPSSRSFSRLPGVALYANAALANTNICNGVKRLEQLCCFIKRRRNLITSKFILKRLGNMNSEASTGFSLEEMLNIPAGINLEQNKFPRNGIVFCWSGSEALLIKLGVWMDLT
ncbi:hypothetical protein OIU76_010938 [Salix suchowensis]|nr:hypothetical protein OIU76_010938 [Salix suchowensis]